MYGWLNQSGVVLGVFLACSVWAAPTAEQIRKATGDYFSAGKQDEGIEKMTGYLSQRISRVSRVPSREMGVLSVAGECVELLELSKSRSLEEDTLLWLLGSDVRLHLFIDVLDPAHDHVKRVVEILTMLRSEDPRGVETYFDLALAIAVVMDKPVRKMHRQMGKNLLTNRTEPLIRFAYFKRLFAGGISKLDYKDLSVRELIFVVHVPVPLSELEWSLQNADGKLGKWGEKYSSIQYDHDRLNQSRFSWDNGTYTLNAIRNQGGICVDQAYFSVITARSFGIPCLYFRGIGESCNHAWFAFMERPGEWHLGIGRYGSEYTTGYAVNPQTNMQMTDHDVAYTCERSLQSDDADRAESDLVLARVLKERDPDSALKCAKEARTLIKRFLPAWEMEREILISQQEYDLLQKQFDEKKDVFRKYPYILADSAKLISQTLKKAGHAEEATLVIKSLAGVLGDDQEDLTYSLELEEIERIAASGNMKKARRELEQMMESPQYGGNKSFGLISKYVEMTKKSGETAAAVKFLEDYVETLVQKYQFPSSYEARLWSMMKQAYQNNGDLADMAKVETRIERLKYR
ncbi:hypothetical protein P4B35_00235 [Pontiellaceae bacterium B12227]|nr:hypothetical protein [Pontiellaceae bacterium B12227]